MKQLFFRLLVAATLLSGLSACKKEDKGIYISFVNASNAPVTNVVVNGKIIGDLAKDTETAPFLFEYFSGGGNIPICVISGMVNNTLVKNEPYECGTPPIPALKAGRYTMVISTVQLPGGTIFTVRFR
jgi:hypothetical protein